MKKKKRVSGRGEIKRTKKRNPHKFCLHRNGKGLWRAKNSKDREGYRPRGSPLLGFATGEGEEWDDKAQGLNEGHRVPLRTSNEKKGGGYIHWNFPRTPNHKPLKWQRDEIKHQKKKR